MKPLALPVLTTPASLGGLVWANQTRLERFWAKVDVGEPDDCWEWLGSRVRRYGQLGDWRNILGLRRMRNPKPIRAHVLSWAIANDRWPNKKEVVRHTCDNPPCCNPRHLLIGNAIDNVRDCRVRRRQRVWAARDDRDAQVAAEVARITPQRAEILRALMRTPQPTMTEIATERGVSTQAIENSLVLMETAGLIRRARYIVMVDPAQLEVAEVDRLA